MKKQTLLNLYRCQTCMMRPLFVLFILLHVPAVCNTLLWCIYLMCTNVSAKLCTVMVPLLGICYHAIVMSLVTDSYCVLTCDLIAVDGKTGFESQAFDGNSFGSHCFTTLSLVQFRCDLGADWTQITDGNATRYLLSAGFSNLEKCLVGCCVLQ